MAWEKTGVFAPQDESSGLQENFLVVNFQSSWDHRWTTSSAIPDYGKTGCRVNSTVVKPENEKIERAENKLSCTVTLLLVLQRYHSMRAPSYPRRGQRGTGCRLAFVQCL